MSDELDRLKQAFERQDNISARPTARKLALETAMKQFAKGEFEKNTTVIQGLSPTGRLRERGSKTLHAIYRRLVMNIMQPKFKHMLAGGVSLAVLAIAIVNIDQITPIFGTPAPTTQDEKKTTQLQNTEIDAVKQKLEVGENQRKSRELAAEKEAVKNVQRSDDAISRPLNEEIVVTMMEQQMRDADVTASQPPVARPAIKRPAAKSAPRRIQKMTAPLVRSPQLARRVQRSNGDLASRALNNRIGKVQNDQQSGRLYQDQGRDKFSDITPNATKLVSEDPVSTFSVDVDTASYGFVRSSINRGVLPQMDAVRIEEMINYFDYKYYSSQDRSQPFATNVSIMPTPWSAHTKLMRIGIKGFELPKASSPRANLVFLIDTSGSMNAPDKLPLLKNSFKLLLASLKPEDTVAIVTYAGSAGMALEPTKIADRNKILAALDRLNSGGATHGADGIHQAYQLAEQQLDKNGVNRVILATDGDFNVGITDPDELKNFVERKRNSGVTLSVLGFGHGNYNDQLMQALAQNGNGNAAYIDTLSEARKVLVEQAGATLFTIAKDVKLQLEFNPSMVSEYRLIGYETRQLRREDFNNDKIDAGDIGAGHSVTALYEITPINLSGKASGRLIDELRYQKKKPQSVLVEETGKSDASNEYAFMKIRYKLPKSDTSQLITSPITGSVEVTSIDDAPQNFRFAAAVAAFGQILRAGRYTGSFTYDDVIELALSARGEDRFWLSRRIHQPGEISQIRCSSATSPMKILKRSTLCRIGRNKTPNPDYKALRQSIATVICVILG